MTHRKYENKVSFNKCDCFHMDKAEHYAELLWDTITREPSICLINLKTVGGILGLKPGQTRLGITILKREGKIMPCGRKYYEVIRD